MQTPSLWVSSCNRTMSVLFVEEIGCHPHSHHRWHTIDVYGCYFISVHHYTRRRRHRKLYWVQEPLLSIFSVLGRLGLVGCDEFKDSLSERDGALSAINTYLYLDCPTFLILHVCLVTSRVYCCCAICTWSIPASLPSLLPCCSPLGPPSLKLGPRLRVPGSTGFHYCTTQPALLRLPAHVHQVGQLSLPKGVMHNAPHNP